MNNRRNQDAFTLIEILIALFIFAILSIALSVGLHSVLRVYHGERHVTARVQTLQLALTLMRNDLLQMVKRGATDQYGTAEPVFQANDKHSVTFTRTGFINPGMHVKRSDMQRVRYQLRGKKLMRISWSVLDRSKLSPPPQTQYLLDNIEQLTIQFVNAKGQVVNAWTSQGGVGQQLPSGIVFRFDFGHGQHLRCLFKVGADV